MEADGGEGEDASFSYRLQSNRPPTHSVGTIRSTHGPCLLTAGVTPAVSVAGPWPDTAGRRQDEESNYSA